MRLFPPAAALLCFLLCAPVFVAQDLKPGKRPHYEFCTGTVIELSAEKVTVRRRMAAQTTEDRPFLLRPQTRVEGALRMNARVTIAFVETADGQEARHILVRRTEPK